MRHADREWRDLPRNFGPWPGRLLVFAALALAAWAVSCTQLPAEVEAGGYPNLYDREGRRLVPVRADWVEQSDGRRTYGMDEEPVVWIAEGAWR